MGSWFMDAAVRWSDEDFSLAIMLRWAIWQALNNQVWKGISRPTRYILALAKGNKIKINVGAAIFESQNCYGFGWVARNNEGRLLWARARSKRGNVSAEFAEAVGLKEVLSWLKDNKLSNVIVESDSLVTIQAIRSSISFNSVFGFCVT
uniref:RNase H type-1 domain-containing protein n=1 Tax=Cannabis sativa TaxID=3483 RepID=A0A803Q309_CANSA